MIRSIFRKIGDIFRRKIPSDPNRLNLTERQQSITTIDPARSAAPKDNLPEKATLREKDIAASPRPRKKSWHVSSFKVPPMDGEVRFHDLDLPHSLMHAVCDLGFKYTTPIQAKILPATLKGNDALGQAQTGTGKSAAFLITVLTRLMQRSAAKKRRKGRPRALVLAPTRELVMQIEKDARALSRYTYLKTLAVFGGMGYEKQRNFLQNKIVDILIATPGRLLDFKQQGLLKFDQVEILVIDEADRMLDMGFIPDIRKIVYSTPPKLQRQTLFFSATMPPDVTRLASQWTHEPVNVEVAPEQIESENVDQIVYLVTADEKFPLLYNLITAQKLDRVIIFANRRDQTRDLTTRLESYNMNCALLSGEVSQQKRLRALDNFKSGKTRILVATDVAARGIHVEGISHVINYTLPQDPEHYVHRIGRTGRAGATGTSISFACEEGSFHIPAIEEFLGHELRCQYPEDQLLKELPPPPRKSPAAKSEKNASSPRRRKSSAQAKSNRRYSYSRNRRRRPKPQTTGNRGNNNKKSGRPSHTSNTRGGH